METRGAKSRANRDPYDRWINSVGIPIHGGFYVEDLRTIELGWWPERECNAAFLVLTGQESVTVAGVRSCRWGQVLQYDNQPDIRMAWHAPFELNSVEPSTI